MSSKAEDYVRWILQLDGAYNVPIAELGAKTAVTTSIAAFSTALEKRFEDGASPDEAREFVGHVRGKWVKSDALNPVLAELAIMDGLGEEGLVDDVPIAELTETQNLLTYAIVNDLGLAGPAVEEFIRESMALLNTLEDEN
ncbi:hypothetical protein [Kineosporia babensis]|uniref:Uncharacterized protein n=1 Tax=Kineosporia babensis TaxID=499548 RepID=A0A9X1T158_9ACTN|nr:hypothetical protein [Kineosporia babensis]MCD5313483.1 hypothetical protein [Kineosporia babensis]